MNEFDPTSSSASAHFIIRYVDTSDVGSKYGKDLLLVIVGKTLAIIPRGDSYHVGQYITQIRCFHLSSVLISDLTKIEKLTISTNERHPKQMQISPRETSIIPTMNTPLITICSNTCRSLWHRIIHEFKHYYQGLKLLCTETKIAGGLVRQMFNGHTLTRREGKQLNRTMADLLRLLPFSIFIIVPFLEFTLPIFLKFFPNMLPSTFKQVEKEREDWKKQSMIKLEAAEFLQDTLGTTIFHFQKGSPGSSFISQPSIEELIKCSAWIANQYSLPNLPRSHLLALSKLLDLSTIGPNSYLRLKLYLKFHRLTIDDKQIVNEGLDNLTDEELRTACHERGMNTLEAGIEQLRLQLQRWLDLHIRHQIPITTLLLSNVFYSSKNRHNAIPSKVTDQIPMPIDIDRLRMGLDQLIEQNASFCQTDAKTTWQRCHANVNQIQRFTTITTVRSKYIHDLVIHRSQTSNQPREMH